MCEKFHQLLAVGRWFPPGTPVSSTRKLISSSFHRLDMTLAVAEALNPNTPYNQKPFPNGDLFPDVGVSLWPKDQNVLNTLLEQKPFTLYESAKDIFSDHQEIDPDFNFYNTINLSCNYFSEEEYLNHRATKNFQIICINIRSAVKNLEKLTTLMDGVLDFCPIIALAETWLSSYNSDLYQLNGYDSFNTVRTKNKTGGGVSLFVKGNYAAADVPDLNLSNPCIETVFVQIHPNPSIRIGLDWVGSQLYIYQGQEQITLRGQF